MVPYRSFATRVSQLKIWNFWLIGPEKSVCRCTFNRYSVVTQCAKLAAGENYSNSKHMKAAGAWRWPPHPLLVSRSKIEFSYTSTLP